MDEIVNKVQDSGLISLDLASFKPSIDMAEIDVTACLWEGLVLKEKDFRAWVKDHSWENYRNKAVYIHCSADAIVPTWAFMLIGSKLVGVADMFLVGSKGDLEKEMILRNIRQLDRSAFKDGKVIIKGCSDIHHPDFAMTALLAHLQPVVKSIMYGEPCSTVPLYKRK
jgi:hypothetical protein